MRFVFFCVVTLWHAAATLGFANVDVGFTGCFGDDGGAVDYFIVLKHPNGGSYSYLDNRNPTFKTSTASVESKTAGALAHTLGPLYAAPQEFVFVIYNDEFPDGHKHGSPRAHAKGVVAAREGLSGRRRE